MIKKSYLVNLCLIFTLFPFVSPYPLASDMQPIAALFGFLVFAHDFSYTKAILSKTEAAFLIFCIWSFLNLGTQGQFLIKDRFTIFFGFFVYYALNRNLNLLKLRTVFYCIIFNFFCALWNIFSTETFITVANFIVRKVKVTSFGLRGITGLSAESSFMSVMAICHAIFYFYFPKTNEESKQSPIIVLFITIMILFFSKSGSGFIMATLIAIIYFITLWTKLSLSKIYLLGVFTFFSLLLLVFFNKLPEMRGLDLLRLALENPMLLLTDSSFQERLIGLHVGLISITNFPLGTGAGSYLSTASYLDGLFDISSTYPLARSGVGSNVSALGTGLTEFGILFPLAFVCLAYKAIVSDIQAAIPLSMAFLMLLFSFSVGFPLIYLMIALANSKSQSK